MGLKRLLMLLIIITLALISFLYLNAIYNENVIELRLSKDITNAELKSMKMDSYLKKYSINYEMPYKGFNLIMTSGNDMIMKNIKMDKGEFLLGNKKMVVIGDRVSDHYFNTKYAVGNRIDVFKKEYEVSGIEKNSKKIYIPYSKDLVNLNWKRKILKVVISDSEMIYYNLDNIKRDLNILGINITDTVIYKEKIYGYLNLIILISTYIFIYYFLKIFKQIKKKVKLLLKEYKEKRRVKKLSLYFKDKKIEILKILNSVIISIIIIIMMKKILSYMHIEKSLIPANLFSLMSYIKILRLKYNSLLFHLENGFSSITIKTIILNIIMTIITIFTFITMKLKKN
ncbi:MAG: ABC transporter permease [Firmicutes bacterium]|nr:ABC transporter permease [Bacillota bacterium]